MFFDSSCDGNQQAETGQSHNSLVPYSHQQRQPIKTVQDKEASGQLHNIQNLKGTSGFEICSFKGKNSLLLLDGKELDKLFNIETRSANVNSCKYTKKDDEKSPPGEVVNPNCNSSNLNDGWSKQLSNVFDQCIGTASKNACILMNSNYRDDGVKTKPNKSSYGIGDTVPRKESDNESLYGVNHCGGSEADIFLNCEKSDAKQDLWNNNIVMFSSGGSLSSSKKPQNNKAHLPSLEQLKSAEEFCITNVCSVVCLSFTILTICVNGLVLKD